MFARRQDLRVGDNADPRDHAFLVNREAREGSRNVLFSTTGTCSRAACPEITQNQVVPVTNLRDTWFDTHNPRATTGVRFSSAQDCILGNLLRPDLTERPCDVRGCSGRRVTSLRIDTIVLPNVLVVSSEKTKLTVPESFHLGKAAYTAVGVALRRPGHYTAVGKLKNCWYYYDDLHPEEVKEASFGYRQVTMYGRNLEIPRLYYFVRTDTSDTLDLPTGAYNEPQFFVQQYA